MHNKIFSYKTIERINNLNLEKILCMPFPGSAAAITILNKIDQLISKYKTSRKSGTKNISYKIDEVWTHRDFPDWYILVISWQQNISKNKINNYFLKDNIVYEINSSNPDKPKEVFYIKKSYWDTPEDKKSISVKKFKELFPEIFEIVNLLYKTKQELFPHFYPAKLQIFPGRHSGIAINDKKYISEVPKRTIYGKLDAVVRKIFLALKIRDWQVNNIVAEKPTPSTSWLNPPLDRIYGFVNNEYFQIQFDDYGELTKVSIPKYELDICGLIDTSLRYYVGYSWHRDRRIFFQYDKAVKTEGIKKTYLKYHFSEKKNQEFITVYDPNKQVADRLPKYLIYCEDDDEYGLEEGNPQYFLTQETIKTIAEWLEKNVLNYIDSTRS